MSFFMTAVQMFYSCILQALQLSDLSCGRVSLRSHKSCSWSLGSMVAKFNNFLMPKKGKLRSVLKRPATSKTKDWKNIPYVRTSEAVPLLHHDHCKWKRSLVQILTATPASLVAMLREDGLLHSWQGSTCPHCQKGTLSKLSATKGSSGAGKHRCSARQS